MEKVTPLSLDLLMTFGHLPVLFLLVVRVGFLPRELPLLVFQSFAFVGEDERPDGKAVRVGGT